MRRVIARSRLGMMMAVASPSGATSIASKPQRRFVTAQPSSAVLVSRPSGGLFAATPIRLCSSTASSAGVTLTPQQIALAIETAAQPLYTLIASGADAETIAEDLLKRTQERLDRAEDSAKVANPTAQDIIDGGLQIVEAEALAQIGLSDHAIGVVEMALRQLTPLLPEQSYYIARAKCLKARLLSQLGQPQQAVETLRGLVPAKAENGAKLSFEDAPSEADGLLLAAFIHSGNATLSEAAEALSHLHMAMKALDEAEAAAVRAADASKDKVEGKILANMEQAKETARSMRVALIVDCAVAQSTVGDFEEALKSLEGAEAAVKALVGATEDSAIAEHPAMADIDYHRAVALATMGRVEEGAVKAAVARRIITSNSPTAFDKIAQAAEVECRCLASMNEGAFAISALDQVIKHIKGISENPNTPDRLVEEGKRSVRKLLVLRLSIIDDRAQHHEIVKAVDAMLPDMEGTSKEGLLFIKMRRAQALAPCGNSWEESLDALHAVRKEAETVLPARIPDIHLSVAVVHLAQGDEAKAMQMRNEVLSTLPEDARSEHNEAEWRFAAAMLALARGNTEVAVAQGEKAVQGMDPRVASSLMAPLYFAAGNHAEAHKRAAQCLQASATAQATPDGTGLRVDKGMAELVAISVLTWPEQQSDEALAKARGQVQAALAVLKADARLLEVARYEAAMHKKFGTASA